MLELNKIHLGNSPDLLKLIDDGSVNMVFTSPPFWGLRDYGLEPVVWGGDAECKHEWGVEFQGDTRDLHTGKSRWNHDPLPNGKISPHIKISQGQFCQFCGAWRGSLGLEPTFELYIEHLIQIFNGVKRVLRKDGTCWVNLGDSYSGSGKGIGTDRTKGKESYTDDDINKTDWKAIGVQAKSLCQIPSRFAIAMTDAGWILRNELIWYKRNCMPSSAKDRFTVDFEKIFFFTKSKKYWFEQQKEPAITPLDSKAKCGFGSKTGKCGTEYKAKTNNVGKSWDKTEDRNKRCVWDITTQPFAEAHFAVFPEELVETPILSGCPEKGIVLDPFMGSGTVAMVALRANRRFIGLEANQEYIDMANKRIEFELKQTKLL